MIFRNPLKTPSSDFSAARDRRLTNAQHYVVDLTSARTDAAQNVLDLAIAGNSFYVDANPADGNMQVEFQDTGSDGAAPRLYCSPGVIFNFPFTRVRIFNAAQPGKKCTIVYGTDMDFQPGSVATLSVNVNPAQVSPISSNVAVATASGLLLAANPARKYLLLQNNSATDVYVNLSGGAAVVGAGGSSLKIAANGGVYEQNSTVSVTAINAISTLAVALTVIEG